MGRIVGRLALTMPMEFSTTAQMIGSTSAPEVVRLEALSGGRSDRKGNAGGRTACVFVGEALDDDGSVGAGYTDALM